SARKAGSSKSDGGGPSLEDLLLGRAPAEDTAAYDPAMLRRATDMAGKAVRRHRKGDHIVQIDRDPEMLRGGASVTVITVVNDNMPFLFDSVMGEITEKAGEPMLVTHPVMVVRHGAKGVEDIV